MTAPHGGTVTVTAAAARFFERLSRPSRILVAVSGGSDSTGLLVALADALPEQHSLCAATIDHRLRAESGDEARAVSRLCVALGIEHLTLCWTGEKPSSGISAAARLARYALLHEAAVRFGADMIVTAHTADDQDETIAMRAARGAGEGRRGLSGMAETVLYRNALWVARPFLDVRREAIRDDLIGRGIGWADDPSNEDDAYERARVRKRLCKASAVAVDGRKARLERSAMAQAAAAWIDAHARFCDDAVVHILPEAFSATPAVQRFALSGLIAALGGKAQPPSAAAMERAIALFGGGKPARMTLGRVLIALNGRGAFLAREGRDLPDIVLGPDEITVWDGRFRVHNVNVFAIHITPSSGAAVACASSVPPSLRLSGLRGLPNAGEGGVGAVISPVSAPYDVFLPGFDLAYAGALARLLGLPPYLRPAFS